MTKTTKKTKTVKTATEEATSTDTRLGELVELSRAFTVEIENIMTAEISFIEKSKALGTATKHYVEYLDTYAS